VDIRLRPQTISNRHWFKDTLSWPFLFRFWGCSQKFMCRPGGLE